MIYNLINGAKLWYQNEANLVITWSRNPHAKTPIPGNPHKSGFIGVWHKQNLYLGNNTIGNGKPPPNKYWFTNEMYLGWRHEDSCSSINLFSIL